MEIKEIYKKEWTGHPLISHCHRKIGTYVTGFIFITDEKIMVQIKQNKRGYFPEYFLEYYTDIYIATKEAEYYFQYYEMHNRITKAFKNYTKGFFEYGFTQSLADADKDTDTTIHYSKDCKLVTEEQLSQIHQFKDICPEVTDVHVVEERERELGYKGEEYSMLYVTLTIKEMLKVGL